MSVSDAIKKDLASIGRDPLQETKEKMALLGPQLAYLGGLGQAELPQTGNVLSKALIVQNGRRRRPRSYWESRLEGDDRVSGWMQMSSSGMANQEDETQNVAEMLMKEQQDNARHNHNYVDETKRSKESYYKSINKYNVLESDSEDEYFDSVAQPAHYLHRSDKASRNTQPILDRPMV